MTPRGLSCESNARRLAADLAIRRAVVHGRNDRQMPVTTSAAAPSQRSNPGARIALLAIEHGQQRSDGSDGFGGTGGVVVVAQRHDHQVRRFADDEAPPARFARRSSRADGGGPERRGERQASDGSGWRYIGPPLGRPARGRHRQPRPRIGRLDRRVGATS